MNTFISYLGQVLIVLALLVLIGFPLGLRERRRKRRKIEEAFAEREPLDEHAFYENYFRARGVPEEVVTKVRRILEEELEVDLSRLAAEADLQRNLSFFWEFDSMADVRLVVRLEEEFGIKITDAEAGRARTVADLVELVWGKVRPRET